MNNLRTITKASLWNPRSNSLLSGPTATSRVDFFLMTFSGSLDGLRTILALDGRMGYFKGDGLEVAFFVLRGLVRGGLEMTMHSCLVRPDGFDVGPGEGEGDDAALMRAMSRLLRRTWAGLHGAIPREQRIRRIDRPRPCGA
jgi:hypothetical protein